MKGPPSLCPYVAKMGQERSLGVIYKGVNPHLRDSLLQLNHIPKDLTPNSVTLGIHF